MKGLIKDLDGAEGEVTEDDFKEEQNSVARLIQMLYSDDPEEMFQVHFPFKICEEAYHDRRTEVYPFTVPPLVFSSLKLARRLQGGQTRRKILLEMRHQLHLRKTFQLLNQVVLYWKLSLVYKDDRSSL
ncbi:hypothetical protein Peur_029523 [Populus x canadensis]